MHIDVRTIWGIILNSKRLDFSELLSVVRRRALKGGRDRDARGYQQGYHMTPVSASTMVPGTTISEGQLGLLELDLVYGI